MTYKKAIKIATYNIHKGFSHFNRRMMIHELRDRLRSLGADIVFLQEVVGKHELHAERFHDWPAMPQYEFLADSIWSEFAYGRNAAHSSGHHGNAVLISCCNDFIITHAATRLDSAACTTIHNDIQTISEWEEGVACNCRTFEA